MKKKFYKKILRRLYENGELSENMFTCLSMITGYVDKEKTAEAMLKSYLAVEFEIEVDFNWLEYLERRKNDKNNR
jgi:hypothetical protein